VLLVDDGFPAISCIPAAPQKKAGTRPTGHGFALPNEYGEAPMNLVIGAANHP